MKSLSKQISKLHFIFIKFQIILKTMTERNENEMYNTINLNNYMLINKQTLYDFL